MSILSPSHKNIFSLSDNNLQSSSKTGPSIIIKTKNGKNSKESYQKIDGRTKISVFFFIIFSINITELYFFKKEVFSFLFNFFTNFFCMQKKNL